MATTSRRTLMGVATAGLLTAPAARAALLDGHAAGLDVAPSAEAVTTIPRRGGEPVRFVASLDGAPLKATSGGWAREITARSLPIATGIAAAHLFINAGGAREMHWHDSAEWAYVLGGTCQVTVQDPARELEVVNLGPGDAWYIPRGHAHAIQTIGAEPFHALLAFDDGLYSEHGTFGISDWMSRVDPATLAQALGVPAAALAAMPPAETYIMQGPIIPPDSPQALAERPLPPERTHRFRLDASAPWAATGGSTIHSAGADQFPLSTTVTGQVVRLEPGAMLQLHWHPRANELLYVVQGQADMSLFAADKRMAAASLRAGDCAYVPANCGHTLANAGSGPCVVVGVQDSPGYEDGTLADWLAAAPRHLLANNLGVAEGEVPAFARTEPIVRRTG